MKSLSYSIRISASRERVWEDILDPKKYREWAKAFSENSGYEGEWKQGGYVTFTDPSHGGTKALIEKFDRPARMHARHVAMITKDGSEDVESDMAKKWIGATETYELREVEGGTELQVRVATHEEFEKVFDDCWPRALDLLKAICERP